MNQSIPTQSSLDACMQATQKKNAEKGLADEEPATAEMGA